MKEEPAHQHFALLVCLLWLFSVISRSVLRGLFFGQPSFLSQSRRTRRTNRLTFRGFLWSIDCWIMRTASIVISCTIRHLELQYTVRVVVSYVSCKSKHFKPCYFRTVTTILGCIVDVLTSVRLKVRWSFEVICPKGLSSMESFEGLSEPDGANQSIA